MEAADVKRLKAIELENSRLKKLLSEWFRTSKFSKRSA
jgi:hypothetical protein